MRQHKRPLVSYLYLIAISSGGGEDNLRTQNPRAFASTATTQAGPSLNEHTATLRACAPPGRTSGH